MTNPDIESLIERLAALSGPNGELEAEIWLAVTDGATRNKWSYVHEATGRECGVDETRDKFGHLVSVPRFTESIDAAMTLVPEGWIWDLASTGAAWVMPNGAIDGQIVIGGVERPAIALCIAALRARAQADEAER